jgi:hypothetical protein
MSENNSEIKWLKGRVEHLEQRRTRIELLLVKEMQFSVGEEDQGYYDARICISQRK